MNARDEASYRMKLAEGFLAEAEQDEKLQRWRSCVDNSQLAVENAGKAVLALMGISPKTHDPAQQLAMLIKKRELPAAVGELLESLLPDLSALGAAQHFLTDYGDEASYISPWELFTRESAVDALAVARRAVDTARRAIHAWQAE